VELLLVILFVGLTILATVGPAVVYGLVIWWFDRYEKEPWGLLAVTFVWGAIPAIFLSLVAEIGLDVPLLAVFGQAAGEAIGGSVVAPIVEEVVKGFAIFLLFLTFRAEMDGVLDGVVYGALVGFGFGMTENALYFLGAMVEGGAEYWLTVVFVRTMLFGLNHGLFSSIVGLGFGYASVANSRWKAWLAPPLALAGSIMIHAVHNISASLTPELCWPVIVSLLTDWGGVLVILVVLLLAWDREKARVVRELRDEIGRGTVSRTDYEIAASYWLRIAAQWRAFMTHGLGHARRLRRLYQLLTELAFKKHRLRGVRDKRKGEKEITRLRAEIMDLRAEISH